MANELATQVLPDYGVSFEPTEINITNYDALQKAVKDYASKFDGLAITSETEVETKKVRAELNKVLKALDQKKTQVHSDYEKPYKNFVGQIEVLKADIQNAMTPIDAGLSELEEKRKAERTELINKTVGIVAVEMGLEPSEFSLEKTWLNKSTSKKKIEEGIKAQAELIAKQKQEFATAVETIAKYAEAKQIDPTGWVDQLKQGQDVNYLLSAIDHAAEMQAQRAQATQAVAPQSAPVVEPDIPQTPVEPKSAPKEPVESVPEEKLYTVTLKFTANLQAMNDLDAFMKQNHIEVERVK